MISEWFEGKPTEDYQQIDFAHKATGAAVEELNKFIDGLSLKKSLAEVRPMNLYRDIEVNFQ